MTEFSKFKERLSSRTSGASAVITDADQAILDEFVGLVRQMISLLEQENGALEERSFSKLPELFDKKSDVSKALEIKEALVLTILPRVEDDEKKDEVKAAFKDLGEAISKNSKLVDRISDAASAVSAEFRRILKRHSLEGLYEKTGKPLNASKAKRRKLDESL